MAVLCSVLHSSTAAYSVVGSGTEFVFTMCQQPTKPQRTLIANTYNIVFQMLHFDTRTSPIEGIDAGSIVELCLYKRQYLFFT